MVLKTRSSSKKSKKSSSADFLDVEDTDDEGFIEGDIATGKVFSTFNFAINTASTDEKSESFQAPAQYKPNEMLSTKKLTYASTPRGLTPPVNGEHYTVKRTYAMRPSTVRKLNALKAEHPDVNVLFNTIDDMAVSHYYNYIFKVKGNFDFQEEKKINS